MAGFPSIKTSVRGDKPVNQDAVLTYEDDALVVLALADGLGSVPHARDGSRAICRSVVRNIRKAVLTGAPLSGANIINWWDAYLRRRGLDPRECRTTSAFVLINKKENKVTSAQIGDSQIYVIPDGAYEADTFEKDFANITDCVGNGGAVRYGVKSCRFRESLRVLIASDGICDELEPDSIPLMAEYFVTRYASVPQHRRNLLLSAEIRHSFSRLNPDDKSMIFLWNE